MIVIMLEENTMSEELITYEIIDEHIALIGLNRGEMRNAFSRAMFKEFGDALTRADDDDAIRCMLVHSHADDFTVGLDVQDIFQSFTQGFAPLTPEQVDPWSVVGRTRTTPLVTAIRGRSFTIGTEFALISDLCVAAENTRFGLREVRVGMFPAGGAAFRLALCAGWVDAMRYVLTGDDFDAHEARRLRMINEVVPVGRELQRAKELAALIASGAPLAVRATLRSAMLAFSDTAAASLATSVATQQALMNSRDLLEGTQAMFQRRPPKFVGR